MASTSFFMELFKAYKAGLFTDFKITCGSTEFMVHKIIICSQSKVFTALCSSGMSESAKSAVNLTEDGTNLVTRMIDCLYSGSYTDFTLEADGEYWKSPHQLHAAMYALGDKWDIAVIKETSLLNFNKHAAKFGSQDLLGLIDSIPIVYSSTPDSERTLRDATVDKVKATPLRYLGDDVKGSFQKVLVEVPDFSWDMHRHWMSGAHEHTTSSKRRR